MNELAILIPSAIAGAISLACALVAVARSKSRKKAGRTVRLILEDGTAWTVILTDVELSRLLQCKRT